MYKHLRLFTHTKRRTVENSLLNSQKKKCDYDHRLNLRIVSMMVPLARYHICVLCFCVSNRGGQIADMMKQIKDLKNHFSF